MNRTGQAATETLKPLIENAYNSGTAPSQMSKDVQSAIEDTIGLVDCGQLRVAQSQNGKVETHAWVKQAILLYFRLKQIEEVNSPPFTWIDKIPLKTWDMSMGVRVVPPAVVRFGAFVAKGCVLMPSYVNVGAYVDEGTMVDTWATVGSCAQIGKNVHLSGGVGIGGVLEPPQAQPVIIEDDCFIGSRAIIVEGVHVRRRAVIGAGVVLTASTPIVDVRGTSPITTKGMIPENCVVIPGSVTKTFKAGNFNVPCALIIGERSAATDNKTSLNQALREFDVPV